MTSPPTRSAFRSFPRTYWVTIIMEFFERSAFFGIMAFLANYFVENIGDSAQWGLMRSITYQILYLLPIISGALAERLGYKKVLGTAFVLMPIAYFGVGRAEDSAVFIGFMILLGVSGGLFKPVISGTIARTTDETTSALGFGIYYWCINLGSLIASLVAAHFVNIGNPKFMFTLAAVYMGLMFFNNLFFYREPKKPGKIKTFADAGKGIAIVFKNWRFLILLVIFSGFWGMYNRSTDSALWLLKQDYIDMAPINAAVSSFLSIFVADAEFKFTAPHIMTVNAAVIVLFQVVVSYLVRKTKPLPTMIVGITLASAFPLMVALSDNPWVFIIGLVIFSLGEITAYPKFISYVGQIAPRDKVAIYMGFVFLPVYFSALFYDYLNGWAWNRLVVEGKDVVTYWYIVAGLGGLTVLALLAYHLLIGHKLEAATREE